MHAYEVTGALCSFGPPQVMKLTDKQIEARGFCVERIDRDGLVRVTAVAHFKRGETFEIPETLDALPGIVASELTALNEQENAPQAGRPKKTSKAKKTTKPEQPDEPDLDALELAIDAAETALAAVDPADAEAIDKAQAAVDEAKAALEAALS